MTRYDPLVVERAVYIALIDVLSIEDCKMLGPDNVAEVGRRLVEISKDVRATRTGGAS